MSLNELKVVKTRKKRLSRAKFSLKKVNLDHLQKQLLTVMQRDTEALLALSFNGKLEKDDATSLNNYLKFIKELKKFEEDEIANMSDEQLNALAKENE